MVAPLSTSRSAAICSALCGRTAVPSAWDSSAALFVVAERLIAGVTERVPEESAARIREMDALRQE